MNFKSDNVIGVHSEIMDAIVAANHGTEISYGDDAYSERLKAKLCALFETNVAVYLTHTGTAANSLALSALAGAGQSIYCHVDSHINNEECGGPEFFTQGAKLIGIPGLLGKMDADVLARYCDKADALRPHRSPSACISVSQATESGTIYSLDELRVLTTLAHERKLRVHMDGARFANALVTLNCTPAEATWKSGVDVLSFGATKNGAMAVEAIIFFNPRDAQNFDYAHKRSGQVASKMRFFSAQLLAYLQDDLWLRNARHANQMAQNLRGIFERNQLQLSYPVQANEVFVLMDKTQGDYLMQQGVEFYEWDDSDKPNRKLYRFVCSCFTQETDIRAVSELLK